MPSDIDYCKLFGHMSKVELSEAQRVAQISSWYWDAQTNVTTSTDELQRIYGFDPLTQQMQIFSQQRGLCYPIEEWERLNAAVHRTLETGAGYELDVIALRTDVSQIGGGWITYSSLTAPSNLTLG